MLTSIDRDRFDLIPIGITPEGAFTLEVDDADRWRMNPTDMPVVNDNGSRIIWPSDATSRELHVRANGETRSLGVIDVVMPMLHGPFGEDGTVQGMLDVLGFPYVGSGVLAHAAGMNKHVSKLLLQGAGIQVTPWVGLTEDEWKSDQVSLTARIEKLGMPLFVKPARAGSSVGVTKVKQLDQLQHALDIAFVEDSLVLVEAAVTGREIEVAVLGQKQGKQPKASLAGEIIVTGPEFYDYDAKYLGSAGVEAVCPANLSAELQRRVGETGIKVFQAIGAEHLARVDVFITEGDDIVVNEINTMPGFTPISMYPKCWEATGLPYRELLTELVELALDRGPYTPAGSFSH